MNIITGVMLSIVAIIAVMAAASFGKVHTLEFALDYDFLTQTISDQTLGSGLHFLGGPWHRLIRYPGTLQNMQFSSDDSPHDELHARTADGLQVVLEITFQYQLAVQEIHDLYEDFGELGYLSVYFDVASHLISEDAAKYSAYEFFNSKETIAMAMQKTMDGYFSEHLHANIISLQIQSSRLPTEFNDAITDTVTQQQNITNTQKYVDSMTVSLATAMLTAQKAANATVATAAGVAEQLILEAEAAATMEVQNGEAQASAFQRVKELLGLTNRQLLEYIWWDAVGGSSADDASVLVGVSGTLLQVPATAATGGG